MSTMPNDRSDAALRERLELAKQATDGPWKESVQIVNGDAVSAVSTACGDEICNTYGNLLCDTFDAAHIAANHPDVVRADIEEILRLRQEVARLELENQRLTVAGANDEAYLLTCLDIIRKAVGMPVGSDWQQVAERVERLSKEADWLVKMLSHYTEDCPLKFKT